MTRYTAAITGASNGIGLDLAQRLLDRGYHVIYRHYGARQLPHYLAPLPQGEYHL